MLPSLIRRVLIAQHRADFRKRFDGLLGEAYRLGADPYAGEVVKSDEPRRRGSLHFAALPQADGLPR